MNLPLATILCGLLLAMGGRAEVVTLAHPGEALDSAKTVVWSPLFQAAWDQFSAKAGGLPLRVEPPNRLMEKLDGFRWEAGTVMPEGSWKTWCGPATGEFLNKVNQEAAALTKEPQGPFHLLQESTRSLAFFGILAHEVEFQRAFFRSTKLPLKFCSSHGDALVQFFGVRGDLTGGYGPGVRVLAWRPVDQSQAIQIRCKQAGDSVILYLPPKGLAPNQDFASACRWLRTWRSDDTPQPGQAGGWDDRAVHDGDEIQIPYISLEAQADFAPLLDGTRFQGPNAIPWTITRAEQLTRFELHEKGARVRVEVSGEAACFSSGPLTTPRSFRYDRPFFVFLWRDQAEWPYFGAWIGDDSALQAFR